jgi:ribonuclease D
MKNKIIYAEGDLPAGAKFKGEAGIDTEMTGLSLARDRLCLVQVADGGGTIYVVKVAPPYSCPNLKKLLSDPKICKIFHFARADIGMIRKCLGIGVTSVFCTKIASKLVRTYTDKHSLKVLVKEFFKVDLNKDEQ